MSKLKEPIYFESGFENFKIDTNEIIITQYFKFLNFNEIIG